MAAGFGAAAAVLAAGGVVAVAAGAVGDGVVARGLVDAPGVGVDAVVTAGADVTGTVVGAGEDDGVGDASGGRDATTAAGGGALLRVGEDAEFGSGPAGFGGAAVRAARSDTGRLGTAAAGREGDELPGAREGVELTDARGAGELDGVEGGRLVAVLVEVPVEGDGFAGLPVRSCFAVDRSSREGVTFGEFTAFDTAGGIGP